MVIIMPKLFEIGTVSVITKGRRAGKKVVVVDIIDENYVLVTGPKSLNDIKRRRMNIKHLIPLDVNLEIERGAGNETVLDAIKANEIEEFMQEEVKVPAHRV